MTPRTIAAYIALLAGAFVAGSEVVDLFRDEASFTVDHFLLGLTAMGLPTLSKPQS